MALSEDGARVVEIILNELERGIRSTPAEFRLSYLAKRIGTHATSIGSAFEDYIKNPLAKNGYKAEKCGNPRVIKISVEEK